MATSFYTYIHCKPDGTPFYVGKGCDRRSREFKRRRSQHYRNIIAKYGAKNIGIDVFPCNTEKEAFERERQQIARLRSEGYELVNHTNGGEGASGLVVPAETRMKLSVALKGNTNAHGGKGVKRHSAEWRGKMSKRMSEIHKGKNLSAEHRAKLSFANKGKQLSASTRAKISAAHKGKKLSA